MVWGLCTHLGMEELVSPTIPNYCNNKGGTAVPTSVALDGPSSSEGSHQYYLFTHNNQLGLLERVAPGDDGQGSFN